MPAAIRTVSAAAAAGLGLSGASYFYYRKQAQPESKEKEIQELEYRDSRPFTLLDPTEIDTRLRSGQIATTVQQKYIKAIYTNRLPSNNPTEDNYSVNTLAGKLFAGVYDGHIGPDCSRLIRKQLPIYVGRELKKEIPKTTNQVQEAITTAFVDLDQDIQQRFYDLFPKNLSRVTEKDVQNATRQHAHPEVAEMHIKEAITGSCACSVYIDGDNVYAANTGDSRVVVVRQEENGTWTGRRLVEEQSPAHPAWRVHMISQHPSNEANNIVQRNRIFGLIAVGGSFGDIMYKVPREYQIKVLPFIPYEIYSTFARYHHRIVVNYRTPPYLQSKPLVSHYKLSKGDRYIILGTDGLWDELSWDNVRSENGDQVAANLMSAWPHKHERNPATHMIREALLYDAVYKNVGQRVPVSNETLEMSKRLTRTPSRRYRDDITVTVIELDMENETPAPKDLLDVGPVMPVEEAEVDQARLAKPPKASWLSGWIWSRL
ncbi:phosphatase 2C-like domain-containing protein [Radiomyces spectabilis]|uniref:phosphatase 2C-like domain-containing protein n=1 Tax=Radiomyces spectabilis TaxID=64574 RepID=UPI002220FB27|nr:phosphatase 2C-like domain-containing protein [Radiomyces spectabilis]KAI8379778.1 phosphatase 2C-like domain-containing protein [Radiomyces spectabilis]